MQLYRMTGGEQWRQNTNWGRGDPCIDRWFGVTCCHVETPYLKQTIREGELESYGAEHCVDDPENTTKVRPPFRWDNMTSGANEITPVGCSSGMVTGTVRRISPACLLATDCVSSLSCTAACGYCNMCRLGGGAAEQQIERAGQHIFQTPSFPEGAHPQG